MTTTPNTEARSLAAALVRSLCDGRIADLADSDLAALRTYAAAEHNRRERTLLDRVLGAFTPEQRDTITVAELRALRDALRNDPDVDVAALLDYDRTEDADEARGSGPDRYPPLVRDHTGRVVDVG